ncbi:MAG: hypothetical protein HYR63_13460 [Proteobacteria bacterium]|nr:hypothetical protein [Pseudomonadota bacterium]MBI3496895.1 hypothetical protein [Pseudomonadota bacterium]
MAATLSPELAKAISRAIKTAIDEGLGAFAQNAAAIAVVRKVHPQLSSDAALAVVLRWRKSQPTQRL